MTKKQTNKTLPAFDTKTLTKLLAERESLVNDLNQWTAQQEEADSNLHALKSVRADNPMEAAKQCRDLRADSEVLQSAITMQQVKISDLTAPIQEQIVLSDEEYHERVTERTQSMQEHANELLSTDNKTFMALREHVLALCWVRGFGIDSAIRNLQSALFFSGDSQEQQELAAKAVGVYSDEVERTNEAKQAISLVQHPIESEQRKLGDY